MGNEHDEAQDEAAVKAYLQGRRLIPGDPNPDDPKEEAEPYEYGVSMSSLGSGMGRPESLGEDEDAAQAEFMARHLPHRS